MTTARRLQPGLEELLDLAATSCVLEPTSDPIAFHDQQRRQRRDPEPRDQVRALLLRDPVEGEGVVISSALQDLRQVSLGPSAAASPRRMEEEKAPLCRCNAAGQDIDRCCRQLHLRNATAEGQADTRVPRI